MTGLCWSVPLAGLGLAGLGLAGRRSYWGWALGLVDEGLWVAYGVHTRQWSFCVSAAAYSWVYWRNLADWRRQAHQTPATPAGSGYVPSSAWGSAWGSAAGEGLLGRSSPAAARAGGRVRAVAVVLVGALVGCGPATAPRPTVTGRWAQRPSGPGGVDRVVLAEFRVRQAYEEFWWVAARLDRQPAGRRRGVLSVVSADPELSRQLAAAERRAARAVHLYGEPAVHLSTVTGAMSLTATVEDCQNRPEFGEADNHTGQPLSTGPATVWARGRLVRDSDIGSWRVTQADVVGLGCPPTPPNPPGLGSPVPN